MKKSIYSPNSGLFKSVLISTLALFSSADIFAGSTGDVHIYLSRGYSTTTADTVFTDGTGTAFSERWVAAGQNTIDDVNKNAPTLFDANGYRQAGSSTPSYVSDGSAYLHLGYYNNACVGSGTAVQDLNLNANLTIGRMAIENTYSGGATPNTISKITAGNTSNALNISYGGGYDVFFFRSAANGALTLDMDINAEVTGTIGLLFNVGGNSVTFGSSTYARNVEIKGSGTANWAISLNGANSNFTSYSNITISGLAKESFRVSGNMTLYGNVTFGGSVNKTGFYLANDDNGTNANLNVLGNIHIKSSANDFALIKVYKSTQVANLGNITIDATYTASTIQALGDIGSGAVVNYNGAIKSYRATEVSINAGTMTSRGIANFKGSQSNEFRIFGFRRGVLNLMKSSGATALQMTVENAALGMGGQAIINSFGENQLDLSKAKVELWSPTDSSNSTNTVSGIINLNGKVNTNLYSFTSSGRQLHVDFGMTNSGMTSAQITAQGITADMINETGAGIAQTFYLAKPGNIGDVATSYILFRNYIVGEDVIICGEELSSASNSAGKSLFSKTELTGNLFRIEGYDDSDKYGVDYWLEEKDLGNGTWGYQIVLVPEPATIAALIGLASLVFAVWRRKKA